MPTVDFFTDPDQFKLQMQGLVTQRMPYGKYKDKLLADLPEHYLVWFKQQGFPQGKLGAQMALLYELRLNGLMHLLPPRAPK